MAHVATNSRRIGAGNNVLTNNGALSSPLDSASQHATRAGSTVVQGHYHRRSNGRLELETAPTAPRTSKVGQLAATQAATAKVEKKGSAAARTLDALLRLRGGGRNDDDFDLEAHLEAIDPDGAMRLALADVDFGNGESWTRAVDAPHDRHSLDRLADQFSDEQLGCILRSRLGRCPCGCQSSLDMPCRYSEGSGSDDSEGSGSDDSGSSDDSSSDDSGSSDESNRLKAKHGGDLKRRRVA